MAKIIPKLNLNKHYRDVEHNSIVDAVNMMVSNDYFTLQTEVGSILHKTINEGIRNLIDDDGFDDYNYDIIYILPCNKEVVIFVKLIDVNNNNTGVDKDLYIFRYNEDENKIVKVIDNFEYHNGNLLGTFTYNYNNLIIAISEHNGDEDVPLRVINLGEFNIEFPKDSIDYKQLHNQQYHPICPKVIIPTVNTTVVSGTAYKGWYYIFIRYKTGTDNYTQWFNTNETVYIDDYSENKYIDYFISDEIENKKYSTNKYSTVNVSNNKDISNLTFDCRVTKLDDKFKNYELGFICISKSYTKAFIIKDIDININDVKFSSNTVIEYSALDLIKTYYNYYNAKTIDVYNNRLYIANYKENNNEDKIIKDLEEIKLSFAFYNKKVDLNSTIISYEVIKKFPNGTIRKFSLNNYIKDYNGNAKYYITSNNFDTFGLYNSNKVLNFSDTGFNDDQKITLLYFNKGGARQIIHTTLNKFIFVFETNSYIAKRIEKGNQVHIKTYNDNNELNVNCYYAYLDNNNNMFKIDIDDDFNGLDGKEKEFYTKYDKITLNIGSMNIDDFDINHPEYYYHPIMITDPTVDTNISNPNISFEYILEKNLSPASTNLNILQLNNIDILPNNYYNFYVHFVDKYGISTKGIQIKYFNIDASGGNEISISIEENKYKDKLLYIKKDWVGGVPENIIANVNISAIPKGYEGFYISYEKLEKTEIYTGIITKKNSSENTIVIYNDRFNYDDNINFDFDSIKIYKSFTTDLPEEKFDTIININKGSSYSVHNIKDFKLLKVADTFNNLLKSTNIEVNSNSNIDMSICTYCVCSLIKTIFSVNNLYTKDVKELIPCTEVCYNTDIPIKLNTKNCFITQQHSLSYSIDTYYNNAVKYFQTIGNINPNTTPYINHKWYYWDDILHESIQFNNKPIVTFFPSKGLHQEDETQKSFYIGSIVEAKNTIDLYQQNQVAVYDLHPKVLDYYNPKLKYLNEFGNIIRRSNVMQDESTRIGWKYFETDDYTNINENKGTITKITGIGTIMLVHTEHSLFQFNSDNSLKSSDDKDIQLNNVDIWDIKYKEILSSKLGYAGLNKEHQAIVGEFGYIFYSEDDYKIYRFDNGSLKRIDEKIINRLRNIDISDITFVDDKHNNRLLLSIWSNDEVGEVLSYNYIIGDFISKHTYKFKVGYSTKNKIYLVNDNKIARFCTRYDSNDLFVQSRYVYEGLNNKINNSKIAIICNINYEDIKYLDNIIYKLYHIISFGVDTDLKFNYSGDTVQIYNEYVDTGNMDFKDMSITGKKDETNKNYNNLEDYKLPYFRLGNWHFSAIRDGLVKYINNEVNNDDMSRIYGNYFIITFSFSNNKLIELDSIDYKISNDLIK